MNPLNLDSIKDESTKENRSRPKAPDNTHIKQLLLLGYKRHQIAEAFGVTLKCLDNWLSNKQETPKYTLFAAKGLMQERQGKPKMLLISLRPEDEAFVKDLLKRSNIAYSELEL